MPSEFEDVRKKEITSEMTNFYTDLWERRKEKVIRVIMDSIRKALRPVKENLGRDFDYWDIVRCARANTGMGDETMACVDEALKRLQLTDVFPKIPKRE